MSLGDQPVAKIELLIRRPVAQVFDAFVNPDVITKFWFNRTSASLVAGKSVTWYWDLYEASTKVRVLALEQDHRIYIEWDVDSDSPSRVEWTFQDRADDGTYVSVVNSGFDRDADDVIDRVVDSTGGFALVLAAAKAYLEHGIALNIVADRF
ncbi:MAG: SRPBCC family protein [Gammaproteobacteria bacterium]|nr:SRPBCC family protein [Gammaproteobacteria bacterium]